MLLRIAIPMVPTLIAAGLTVLVARGEWFIYRVLLGAVACLFSLFATLQWAIFVLSIQHQASEPVAGAGQYVGWDARAILPKAILPGIVIVFLLMVLYFAVRNLHMGTNLRGRT
jgi:hypothetical protein